MKTLFIDCSMGAAGDMLAAALLELHPDPDGFIQRLNAAGIPGVELRRERIEKNGIFGTMFSVKVHGEEEGSDLSGDHHEHHHEHTHEHHGHVHTHSHSDLTDIGHIVNDHLNISDKVKKDVLDIYGLIADAESRVHGVPVTEIHFHEVGALDAVADITAVCLLMDELAPDEVIASPVHVGSGHVKCAHGILPVPAPATAFILQGVPIYGGTVEGELCTPTGAAILKHFVTRFGEMPVMKTESIGYGMGKKNFETLNCVRVMLGETAGSVDIVCELSCNVDDMTAEEIGFAMEQLFEGGAQEVYTVPIGMKKNRPGTLICVLCRQDVKDRMIRLMYENTTTIGIRETLAGRFILDRKITTVSTACGEVRVKTSEGYGVRRRKYEYDDVARIARERGIGLAAARDLIRNSENKPDKGE